MNVNEIYSSIASGFSLIQSIFVAGAFVGAVAVIFILLGYEIQKRRER